MDEKNTDEYVTLKLDTAQMFATRNACRTQMKVLASSIGESTTDMMQLEEMIYLTESLLIIEAALITEE